MGKLQKCLPTDQQDIGAELPEDWKEWPHHLKWLVTWWASDPMYQSFDRSDALEVASLAVRREIKWEIPGLLPEKIQDWLEKARQDFEDFIAETFILSSDHKRELPGEAEYRIRRRYLRTCGSLSPPKLRQKDKADGRKHLIQKATERAAVGRSANHENGDLLEPQGREAVRLKTIRTFEKMNSFQVPRRLVRALGLNTAIILANFLSKAKGHQDGESRLFRTISQNQLDTGLGKSAQRAACIKLMGLGILEQKSWERDRKDLYRINYERLGAFLSGISGHNPKRARRGRQS